jgi:transcriptional regulator NrdR family protein
MSKMVCPKCAERDNHTLETREHPTYNWVKRRRACYSCDYKWSTIELAEDELQIEGLE